MLRKHEPPEWSPYPTPLHERKLHSQTHHKRRLPSLLWSSRNHNASDVDTIRNEMGFRWCPPPMLGSMLLFVSCPMWLYQLPCEVLTSNCIATVAFNYRATSLVRRRRRNIPHGYGVRHYVLFVVVLRD